MRYLALCSVLLCCAACEDEDAHVDQHEADHPHDGPSDHKDAGQGTKDAGVTGSALPRPSLPRPPKGLPAELRPPR